MDMMKKLMASAVFYDFPHLAENHLTFVIFTDAAVEAAVDDDATFQPCPES